MLSGIKACKFSSWLMQEVGKVVRIRLGSSLLSVGAQLQKMPFLLYPVGMVPSGTQQRIPRESSPFPLFPTYPLPSPTLSCVMWQSRVTSKENELSCLEFWPWINVKTTLNWKNFSGSLITAMLSKPLGKGENIRESMDLAGTWRHAPHKLCQHPINMPLLMTSAYPYSPPSFILPQNLPELCFQSSFYLNY